MATLAGVQTDAADAAAEPVGVSAAGSLGFAQVVTGITAIVAPATLVTSIAYYFGWVHTDAWARYFGLDPSVLGYSTRDYVLASLRPLFLPVVGVLLVLVASALAHAFVDRTLETDLAPHYSKLWKASALVGAGLLVAGAFAVFGTVSTHYLFGTLAPACGVILITYGISLRRRLHGQPPLPPSPHVLVALLAVLSLFWAAGIYAGDVGRATARDLGLHLRELPAAVVYSGRDLDIPNGYGVRMTKLAQSTAYPYAYSGFRLLERSDGKYFLLPRWWTPRDGAMALVLPEDDSWRIALTPGVHVRSTLSAAFGGGLIGKAGVIVKAAGAARFRLGPFDVDFLHASTDQIIVTNRLARRSGRVGVRGSLTAGATPLVIIDNGSCTIGGRRFRCATSGLGPHGSTTVTIVEKDGRSAGGSAVVRAGGRVVNIELELDER